MQVNKHKGLVQDEEIDAWSFVQLLKVKLQFNFGINHQGIYIITELGTAFIVPLTSVYPALMHSTKNKFTNNCKDKCDE